MKTNRCCVYSGTSAEYSSPTNVMLTFSHLFSSCFSGEVWTEAALDEFERLTYCASWRPLQAKLCSYSHSEISSWPSVRLSDTSEGKVSCFFFFFSRYLFGLFLIPSAVFLHTRCKTVVSPRPWILVRSSYGWAMLSASRRSPTGGVRETILAVCGGCW